MTLNLYQYRCECDFVFWLEIEHDTHRGGLVCPSCESMWRFEPTGIHVEFEGLTKGDDDVLASRVG